MASTWKNAAGQRIAYRPAASIETTLTTVNIGRTFRGKGENTADVPSKAKFIPLRQRYGQGGRLAVGDYHDSDQTKDD